MKHFPFGAESTVFGMRALVRLAVEAGMAACVYLHAGCAGIASSTRPQDEWRTGRVLERQGDFRGAIAAYRSASARGDKMALYDAGRLALKTSKDPAARKQGLKELCDCANPESAGFYFVQENSEAARAAALSELAHAFETGLGVEQDVSIAGYLYKKAEEVQVSNAQWFSRNSAKAEHPSVFESTRGIQGGLSRTCALGYSGENYRWTEIAERIRPPTREGNASAGKRRKEFEIVSMSFDNSGSDETIFEYRIPEGTEFTLSVDDAMRREMFAKVKQEYCARHPGVDPADVRASATHYQKTGARLTYRVAAFWLHPSELDYSASTREGILRLRFDGKDILDAQEWAKSHLEELVVSQNVVLTAGQRPPENAKYRIGSIRSIDEGTRLEVHFKAVE
jgi:hypothetical protein